MRLLIVVLWTSCDLRRFWITKQGDIRNFHLQLTAFCNKSCDALISCWVIFDLVYDSVEGGKMTVKIISWSISTKIWGQVGVEFATPRSAVRLASVARHVTDSATRFGQTSSQNPKAHHTIVAHITSNTNFIFKVTKLVKLSSQQCYKSMNNSFFILKLTLCNTIVMHQLCIANNAFETRFWPLLFKVMNDAVLIQLKYTN